LTSWVAENFFIAFGS